MCDDNNNGKVVAFLAGAAIGAGLALLFAPQSGKETRKKIKDTSEKVAGEVKERFEDVKKGAKETVDKFKVTAEKAAGNVKSFLGGTKEKSKA